MIVLHQKSHPPLYAATKLKRCPSIIDPKNSKDWQVGGPASQNKAQDSLHLICNHSWKDRMHTSQHL